MKRRIFLTVLSAIAIDAFAAPLPALTAVELKKVKQQIINDIGKKPSLFDPWKSESLTSVTVQSVQLSDDRSKLKIYCGKSLAQISIRYELLERWADDIRSILGDDYADCDIKFYSNNILLDSYVPNYYRPQERRDPSRKYSPVQHAPLVRQLDESVYGKGLVNSHIALWGGHGRLYHGDKSAWKWQRPALFCSIEDLNTAEFTTSYLAPMLEQAGAVVLMPRERDPQPTEIIVDNDHCQPSSSKAHITTHGEWVEKQGGFAVLDTLRDENPFAQGSVLQSAITSDMNPSITYFPVPESAGRYGLYVSWRALPTNIRNAVYTVQHAGGVTRFEVNQRIGGAMWVWLGMFDFDKNSQITLSAPDGTPAGSTLTADAIKLGGGMGNVLRAGSTSGMSRYAEAARYWMQYSGVTDSVYAQDTKAADNTTGKILDYTDNYKGNGDWCNYLINRKNIPLDLSLGLHTDAGVSDTTVGTLSIHYTNKTQAKYSNGKSKMAGRDLADLIQTQLVEDMRTLHSPTWTRRSMYDKSYAEISRPDVPSMLIEMLSHQNAEDMALGLDPVVRFDIARSVYKGILRFMADRYGREYTVAPLAPRALSSQLRAAGDSLLIRWSPTIDPLESTALPTHYKLYTRIGDQSAPFDNGKILSMNDFTEATIATPRDGQIRSYRITALNDGGESFPSETIAVGFHPKTETVRGTALIVNGFTRVSPPQVVYDTIADSLGRRLCSGLDMNADPGVPYLHDGAIVGAQTNHSRSSQFIDNDMPGWGASGTGLANKGLCGNSFDYIILHGQSLMELGYDFVGTSREAFESDPFIPSRYRLVDVIMGAQRSYPARYNIYNDQMLTQLKDVIESGVYLIISGAYLASDPSYDSRAADLLGYRLDGTINSTSNISELAITDFEDADRIYRVPGVVEPISLDQTARAIHSGRVQVAVCNKQIAIFGVPLEVLTPAKRTTLLKQLIIN